MEVNGGEDGGCWSFEEKEVNERGGCHRAFCCCCETKQRDKTKWVGVKLGLVLIF